MKKTDPVPILAKANEVVANLTKKGISVKLDDRENYNPGWKFNHWELKGIPIRIEFGPKDFEKNQVVAVRRDTGEKETIPIDDQFETRIEGLLSDIQNSLFEKAKKARDEHIVEVTEWSQF